MKGFSFHLNPLGSWGRWRVTSLGHAGSIDFGKVILSYHTGQDGDRIHGRFGSIYRFSLPERWQDAEYNHHEDGLIVEKR